MSLSSSASVLESKKQSSVTVAITGPYGWLPGLKYNGSEVVGGMEKLPIAALSNLTLWNYDSWWFWNQEALAIAIDEVNNDPNILPNTTIIVRRFNNIYGKPNSAFDIALANDIGTNKKDIVAVFSGFSDFRRLAQIYAQYQIPMCIGDSLDPRLDSRSKYPYSFQTLPSMNSFAQSIMLTLKYWNVKRVAMLDDGGFFAAKGSWCATIANVLEQNGFLILAKIPLRRTATISSATLSSVGDSLTRADARYFILCGSPTTTANVYYGFAKRKQLVGNDFVWFSMNKPDTVLAKQIYGPDYYKITIGFMNVYGINAFTDKMLEQEMTTLNRINSIQTAYGASNFTRSIIELYYNVINMHDCPKIFAAGLSDLLQSNPSLLNKTITSDAIGSSLNWTLFRDTGVRGIVADPLALSSTGGLSSTFYIQCVDGTSPPLTSVKWAITDLAGTKITPIDGSPLTFFDGTSNPPPDGPTYQYSMISRDNPNGALLMGFTISGIIGAVVFFIVIQVFQKKVVIKSGSAVFMSILALGTIFSYVSNLTYIGVPTLFNCQARLWLQLTAFILIIGAMLARNWRVALIYGSSKALPKYILKDAAWIGLISVFLGFEMVVSAALIISAIILRLLDHSGFSTDHDIKEAILVFVNTSIPLLMQAVPRMMTLLQTEVLEKKKYMGSSVRWSIVGQSQNASHRQSNSTQQGSFINQKGRQSSQVPTGTAKANSKFSKLYVVSICVNSWPLAKPWKYGVATAGFVRKTPYVQILPLKNDKDSQPFGVLLDLGKATLETFEVTAVVLGKIRQERLTFISKSGERIVMDFEKDGEAAGFRDSILAMKGVQLDG
ncbi:UNVERIFIED_CONTAM: hypothetical protein HDU68_012540 [Siphonaria sp. JEL0065]|nr:hypothetical protein HDU68_012540 [Siphonaria sp. JEL0065]